MNLNTEIGSHLKNDTKNLAFLRHHISHSGLVQ